jgi:uncharacterized protein (TIGR03067 family)
MGTDQNQRKNYDALNCIHLGCMGKGDVTMEFKNYRVVFLLFMLTMLFVACSTPAELEGTWIGYATGGPLRDWILIIERNQFELVCEDANMWYRGRLELNNNCDRNKMDLIFSATAAQTYNGATSYGIYEIEADTLVLVAAEPGNAQRPFSFDQTQASIAFVFERYNQE